jgi:hypothetical protein
MTPSLRQSTRLRRAVAALAITLAPPILDLSAARAADTLPPQRVEWSVPLNAPFVDIFRLLPDDRLLVGAMTFDAGTLQFKRLDLRLLSTIDGSTVWTTKRDPLLGTVSSVVGLQHANVIVQAATAKETRLFAYALADGTLRWTAAFKGVAASLTLGDAATVVVATAGEVSALDSVSGELRWSKAVQARGKSEIPALVPIADSVCVIAGAVACLDRGTGAERWGKTNEDGGAFGRALQLGPLLIAATDNVVTAWNAVTGARVWRVASPSPGLVDLAATPDGAALHAAWLDPSARGVLFQSIAATDGKVRWTSDLLPMPRSAIAPGIAGLGYFTSVAQLLAIDLETGSLKGRVILPSMLANTARKPDDLRIAADGVTVFNEFGAVTFATRDLKLMTVAPMQSRGASTNGLLILQEEREAAATNAGTKLVLPPPISENKVSPLQAAAQARIRMAYAQVRPTLESRTASHQQKAAAHGYVATEIQGAIAMQRQAIAMERMDAAMGVASAAVGLMAALAAQARRESEARLALFSYFPVAGGLRNEGTPAGFAINNSSSTLDVYDAAKNAVGSVNLGSESQFSWPQIAVLSGGNNHLLTAHASSAFAPQARTEINSKISRPPLVIESRAMAGLSWKPAAPPPADPELEQIRAGKAISLQDLGGACFLSGFKPKKTSSQELVYAAIAGRNVEVLEHVRLNGHARLSWPSMGFDAEILAQDTLDPKLIDVVARGTRQHKLDFALARATALDEKSDVAAAIDAGASPDGFGPLSATRSCNGSRLIHTRSNGVREVLLARGAHVNILDADNKTPLDHALSQKNGSLEKFLRERGGKTASELTP